MDSLTLNTNSEAELNSTHRCDQCGARALVLVKGKVADLMFCSHHYNKIMDNARGYDKMMKFAIEILDKRYVLETKEDLEEAIKR
jgi:hypothetical protein